MPPITEERIIELLNTQKEDIIKGITVSLTEIKNKISEAKGIAEDAITLGKGNSDQIDSLTEKIDLLTTENTLLANKIDDQINRNMRKTLIFKGIPQQQDIENTWEKTESTLINILINEANVHPDHANKIFERVHRGKKGGEKYGPPHIYACCYSWKDAQKLIRTFKEPNYKKNSQMEIYVEQLYSPEVTKRRNEAMKVRKTLKNNKEIMSGYVEYPAILMVKHTVKGKYEKHSSY